jgi:hypothetical protein
MRLYKNIFMGMQRSIFSLVLIMLSLASCNKEYVVPNRTIITELFAEDWDNLDQGRNFVAEIDMPEIDDYVNEHHGVLVYVSFGNRTYEQIPQVYNGVSYTYFTRPGQLVMELQSSDGISVVTPPGSMTVKIVLIESL